jgi:hypothetical protein
MRTYSVVVLVTLALFPTLDTRDATVGDTRADLPRFSGKSLECPTGYDTWPVVGASLGLSYSKHSDGGPGSFHRVYMNPSAYAAFKKTGEFPDGTTFVLSIHEARERGSILRGGFYEGAAEALEASVKDRSRFPTGWAYFDFGNGSRKSAAAFDDNQCHACHSAHGEKDSVFVQFYPNLRRTQ